MVYRLRSKFIRIVMLSFLVVFLVLFLTMFFITDRQTNASLDMFADLISQNGGRFPKTRSDRPPELRRPPFGPERMNPEAAYSTRFFSVQFDRDGGFAAADTAAIASVTQDEAIDYAERAMGKGNARGWMGDYRYKVYPNARGTAVVFVNGAIIQGMHRMFLLSAAAVFLSSSVVVLLLVVFASKRAVKPIAESYEKQKQFVTDANHELKTPLTLIRTDLELAESELGKNEWLDGIREGSERMTELVGKLVTLARMDEERTALESIPFDLSGAVLDTVSAFEPLAERSGLTLRARVAPGVSCTGDETALRQLTSILLDNAVKYCDPGGRITLALTAGKHPVLTVDNTCCAVDGMELKRLFDRFYRSDRARTAGNGFGIGLSIAKAIAEKHHAQMEAQAPDGETIRFWVRL